MNQEPRTVIYTHDSERVEIFLLVNGRLPDQDTDGLTREMLDNFCALHAEGKLKRGIFDLNYLRKLIVSGQILSTDGELAEAAVKAEQDFQEAVRAQERKAADMRMAEYKKRSESPIIDATSSGVAVWRCQCGQKYLLENGQKGFRCPNGCPGHMTRLEGLKRPAAGILKQMRGER